ncbi:hypothetical protein MOUN0_I00122 [Monosporozyma unispora]
MNGTYLPDWENESGPPDLRSIFHQCNIEIERVRQYQVNIFTNENSSVKEKLEALEDSQKLLKIITEIAEELQNNDGIENLIERRMSYNLLDPKSWNRPQTYVEKLRYQIRIKQLKIVALIFILLTVLFIIGIAIYEDTHSK